MTYGRTVELSLQAANIPFLSSDLGRTSVLQEPGSPNSIAPQIIYAQNVLPTAYGYSSIRKDVMIAADSLRKFQAAQQIFSNNNTRYTLASTSTGAAAALAGSTSWTYQNTVAGITPLTEFSCAQIDGRQLFCFSNIGFFEITVDPIVFVSRTFVGLLPAEIKFITGTNGYVICVDDDTVYWDSPGARLNFTPALGGAGSTKLASLRGRITAVYPIANGFIVYASGNAVSAQFTGNANTPWVFREIPGSGGIAFGYNVAVNTNLDFQLAWTSQGLQQLAVSGAKNLLPQFTEFAQGGRREYLTQIAAFSGPGAFLDGSFLLDGSQDLSGVFGLGVDRRNFPQYQLDVEDSGVPYNVSPAIINNRYFVFSYGKQSATPTLEYPKFQEALVYDLELQLWGKINEPHVTMFSLGLEDGARFLTYKAADVLGLTYDQYTATAYNVLTQPVAFRGGGIAQFTGLNEFGELRSYTRHVSATDDLVDIGLPPALLFGRLAIYKQRPTQIHQFEFNEFNFMDPNSAVLFWSTMNSSSFETFRTPINKLPVVKKDELTAPKIQLRKTAMQFGFGLIGNFNLKTVLVRCGEAGSR